MKIPISKILVIIICILLSGLLSSFCYAKSYRWEDFAEPFIEKFELHRGQSINAISKNESNKRQVYYSQTTKANYPSTTKDFYFETVAMHAYELAENGKVMHPKRGLDLEIKYQKNGKILSGYLQGRINEVLENSYGANFHGGIGTTWWARLNSDILVVQQNINEFYYSKYIVEDEALYKYYEGGASSEYAHKILQQSVRKFEKLHSSTPKPILKASWHFLSDYKNAAESIYKNVAEKVKIVYAKRERIQREAEEKRKKDLMAKKKTMKGWLQKKRIMKNRCLKEKPVEKTIASLLFRHQRNWKLNIRN